MLTIPFQYFLCHEKLYLGEVVLALPSQYLSLSRETLSGGSCVSYTIAIPFFVMRNFIWREVVLTIPFQYFFLS